jgi:hypothetical protein
MPGGAKIGVSAAVLGDHLFVVGGFDDSRCGGDRIVSDIERYNIATDRQEAGTFLLFNLILAIVDDVTTLSGPENFSRQSKS